MDTIETQKTQQYRQIITSVLDEQPALIHAVANDPVETHAIYDDRRGRYLLYQIGWSGKRRTHTALVYVRIHKGKIWIEEDWTEDGITPELLAAGVPKEDIVLGFRHPSVRSFTDFAVA